MSVSILYLLAPFKYIILICHCFMFIMQLLNDSDVLYGLILLSFQCVLLLKDVPSIEVHLLIGQRKQHLYFNFEAKCQAMQLSLPLNLCRLSFVGNVNFYSSLEQETGKINFFREGKFLTFTRASAGKMFCGILNNVRSQELMMYYYTFTG